MSKEQGKGNDGWRNFFLAVVIGAATIGVCNASIQGLIKERDCKAHPYKPAGKLLRVEEGANGRYSVVYQKPDGKELVESLAPCLTVVVNFTLPKEQPIRIEATADRADACRCGDVMIFLHSDKEVVHAK